MQEIEYLDYELLAKFCDFEKEMEEKEKSNGKRQIEKFNNGVDASQQKSKHKRVRRKKNSPYVNGVDKDKNSSTKNDDGTINFESLERQLASIVNMTKMLKDA